MRIISWNVNGLRSTMKKGTKPFFTDSDCDIFCIQEIKMQEDLFSGLLFSPKVPYWNYALKRGYSGVATIIDKNINVISVKNGIGDRQLDGEGRVLTIEFDSFTLVNTYAPHSHRKLLRLEEKERFILKFCELILELRKLLKPIIIVGDLNVAHQEIDLYHYKANKNNAGFLPQERQWFTDLLSMGFVDAFRYLYPEKKEYSWWGLTHNLRERNIGWRIDYVLVDTLLKDKINDCYYSTGQIGSDHCPVIIDIDI